MSAFSVRGFTAATGATADHVIAALWNPDTLKRIKVFEVAIFKAGAGAANDSLYIVRITARGTPGSTVTPDADNAWEGDDVPASGSLLDLAAYSVQPTRATPGMFGWVAAAVAASGVIWPMPRGLSIPPLGGLAIAQRAATAWPTSEVTYSWEE